MKKTAILALILSAVLCLGLLTAVSAAGENSIEVGGHTVALEDSVHLVYYVDENHVPAGAETGLLLWKTQQAADGYTYDKAEYRLANTGETFVYNSTTYQTYRFKELAAKEMTTDIYAVAYYQDGGTYYYSKLDKYSVLQYAFNKKSSASIGKDGVTTLGQMVTELLDYGTIAQRYLGYRLDRLANDAYYQVTVEGGTLLDGTTKGLYAAGTKLTLTTDIADAAWTDDLGNPVSATVTVPAAA